MSVSELFKYHWDAVSAVGDYDPDWDESLPYMNGAVDGPSQYQSDQKIVKFIDPLGRKAIWMSTALGSLIVFERHAGGTAIAINVSAELSRTDLTPTGLLSYNELANMLGDQFGSKNLIERIAVTSEAMRLAVFNSDKEILDMVLLNLYETDGLVKRTRIGGVGSVLVNKVSVPVALWDGPDTDTYDLIKIEVDSNGESWLNRNDRYGYGSMDHGQYVGNYLFKVEHYFLD